MKTSGLKQMWKFFEGLILKYLDVDKLSADLELMNFSPDSLNLVLAQHLI